ncbi:MAG: hypothetical protein Q9188_000988 [Gyalolechia gomerana]
MTYIQAALSASFFSSAPVIILLCASIVTVCLYRVFLHPLSHLPGLLLARITSLHLYTICFLGIECSVLESYHRRYNAPVLRIAPNAVSISNGAALHSTYIAGGGFPKAPRYQNFRLGGYDTIFSSRDTGYRDLRAKAVAPLFAMSRIRAASCESGIIGQCIARFVERFEKEKADAMKLAPGAAKFDILGLTYRLMMDSVTGYLFGNTFGALEEEPISSVAAKASFSSKDKTGTMSALPFIFAIVEAGRFSLLPNWLFGTLNVMFEKVFPNQEFQNSLNHVRDFAARVTNEADPKRDDTYQSRLLAAGIAKPETVVQCMAVIFAGTDSTAVKLVTIIFHLVQNPYIRERLRKELRESEEDHMDPQNIPYLCAVVKEGLRLGMANPARFSRTAPPGGFEISGVYVPGGTDVGLAPYTLHHNPELFPRPFEFRPERWLDEEKDGATGSDKRSRKIMERDLVPFSIGLRACIARNFATHELFLATKAVVGSGILEGAQTCTKTIELEEFFNVGIKDHKLEIQWSPS